MRASARWLTTAVLVVAGSVLTAAPASAHPTDETLQQIYLTPAASGSSVQLDLTPGVLVAPGFARTLDADGDGELSAGEIDGHAAAVRAGVTVAVDGRTVDLSVTERRYPALDLLAAGGGTITLVWAVPAGAHEVRVTDSYEPGGRTTVQMSVLVAADPVALGPISHLDGGRVAAVGLDPAAGAPVTTAGDPVASSGSRCSTRCVAR